MQKDILVACALVMLECDIVDGCTEPDDVEMLAVDSPGKPADDDVIGRTVDEQDSDIRDVHVVGWAQGRVGFGA
ncbi:unnamed protein product [marine sediment metagenome]|uniref:Uncharacterized protein n=1 Tax=marine sediment metagenome TaxID=412755 RepID=X1G236_9ZZZZ